ncbi:hypothetical protein [Sphingomonas sp. Leaf33]|uniref:hypothetical protein n=1 Tax=Sphingomonas sp. Leaf33 TaxID=1736215 RepID=UPI000AE46E84|nr:hypothetical protein [Sphingomonas sp. Leaf33]
MARLLNLSEVRATPSAADRAALFAAGRVGTRRRRLVGAPDGLSTARRSARSR